MKYRLSYLIILLSAISISCPANDIESFAGWTDEQFSTYSDSIYNTIYSPVITRHTPAEESIAPVQKMTANETTSLTNTVPTSIDIDRTKAVGEIPIYGSSTPTGAKVYEIPIDAYPGMNGMTPEIKLYYNSQQPNSLLGNGWSISGLSVISRGNSTAYYDGTIHGPNLDLGDAFFLDGNRLLLQSNLSTKSLVYATEQGNILVDYHHDNTTSAPYFIVYYPNGYKGTYGFSDNSYANQINFPITSLSDIHGNTIHYNYIFYNNTYRISSITYNNASIEFSYKGRNDSILSYSGGVKTLERYLLSKIVCKLGTTTLNTYNLTYTSSYSYSNLIQIDYEAGGKSLNPIKFYYNTNYAAPSFSTSDTQLTGWFQYSNASMIKAVRGRFDYSDGTDGLIVLPNRNPYWNYYRNLVGSDNSSVINKFENKYSETQEIFIYTGLNDNQIAPMPNLTAGKGFIDIFCADLDGKQEETIIKVNNVVDGNNDKVTFTAYWASGIGGMAKRFSRTYNFPTVLTDNDRNKSIHPKFYFTGDFNGDGKMEILAISVHQPLGRLNSTAQPHNHPSVFYLFDLVNDSILYQGNILDYKYEFLGTRQSDPQKAINNSDLLFPLDYDGDGKTDLCHISNEGTFIYSFGSMNNPFYSYNRIKVNDINRDYLKNKDVLLGDFNGDGLTDFLVSPISGIGTIWTIFYSIGNGQFEKTLVTRCNKKDDANSGFMAHDVDNDGKTDLIEYSNDYLKIYTFAESTKGPVCSIPFSSTESLLVPVDLNSHNTFTNLVGLTHDKATKYTYSTNLVKDVLAIGMANSLGIVEHNQYALINQDGVASGTFSKGYNAKFPFVNIQEQIPVLASNEIFCNNTSVDKNTYNYQNAVFHRQGRGFMGFEKVTTINARAQRTVETYAPYDYSQLLKVSSPKEETTHEYLINQGQNHVVQVLVSKKTEKDKLKNLTKTTESTFDKYGYPTLVTEKYAGDIIHTKSISYRHLSDLSDRYCLGTPSSEKVTYKYGSSSHIESKSFILSDQLQPTTSYHYINGQKAQTTYSTYDAAGNNLSEVIMPYSGSGYLNKLNSYDSIGRVIKTVDKYGLSTEYSYNKSGFMISEKDSRNNITSRTYDSFGRIISIRHPDGVTEKNTLEWSDICDGAVFSIKKENTSAPTEYEIYDALKREIRHSDIRFDGSKRNIDRTFNFQGNVLKESLPYTSQAPVAWINYMYDSHDRLLSRTLPNGQRTSYGYSGNSITTTEHGISTKRIYDALGNLTEVSDPSGKVTYKLGSKGQPVSITSPGGISTSLKYDNFLRQISIDDPSQGVVAYHYDKSGNRDMVVNAKGDTISYLYDDMQRVKQIKRQEFNSSYSYNDRNELTSVVSSNQTIKEFEYDKFGRMLSETDYSFPGEWHKKEYAYSNGNVSSVKHTSNRGNLVTEKFQYSNGTLNVAYADSILVLKKIKENGLGQLTEVLTGDITRKYEYNSYGIPVRRSAANSSTSFYNFSYSFDAASQCLLSRTDNKLGKKESFSYDNLNRLTSFGGKSVEYDDNGNILSLSDIGGMSYDIPEKPYAISEIDSDGEIVPVGDQEIRYSSFSRPEYIYEGSYRADFTYNADHKRVNMQVWKSGTRELYRTYLSDCYELDIKTGKGLTGSQIKEKVYLYGDYYTAPVVMVKENNAVKMYHIFRDYLGSVIQTATYDGQIAQEISYDAWGRMRNPQTHEIYSPDNKPRPFLGRGYTGHEELYWFGLVNMNSRLYDPALGRFLSPDPYIQTPDAPQNFNRYSYCLNNPLIYNDPEGEFFIFTIFNAITDTFLNMFSHGFNFSQYSWKRTTNSWKIETGMFRGNFGQILGKWTVGIVNSFIGKAVANFCNTIGMVDNVTYLNGVAALSGVSHGTSAFTIGHYSMGPDNYRADWKDHLFVHEYGHFIQSLKWGPLYLPVIGAPSLISAAVNDSDTHKSRWFEREASRYGAKHFDKKYGSGKEGYKKGDPNYFDINSFRTKGTSTYVNPRNNGNNKSAYPIHRSDVNPESNFNNTVL